MDKNDHTTELRDDARARREFLKKSAYVAYTTPIIWSLLVEKAEAIQSWDPGRGRNPGDIVPPPPFRQPPR